MEITQTITKILKDVAKSRSTISYTKLSEQLRLHDISIECQEMGPYLCSISENEHNMDRGMLSIVVVQRSEQAGVGDGFPSWGFFKQAKKLGYDVSDKSKFFREHLEFVYNANQ